MKFIPDYSLNIISEEDFSQKIVEIETTLEKIKIAGSYKAFDGIDIAYEYFLSQNSKASIVIVHGLSEFTKKYYEFIYYCLNQGFNVFIYDQRCHGLSGRLTDRIELLHVDSFDDYVDDLTRFIDDVVLKTVEGPLYLYSHSMGSAVCALYLAKHTDKIEKAVFSAPMFVPVVDSVPLPIARMGVSVGRLFYGNKTKFLLTSEFDPDAQYKSDYCSSKARFEHNMMMRVENPSYQSTPLTFGWVHNSLIVNKKIFKKDVIDKIKTPILLFSAERDMTVENEPQYKFAKRCKNCQLIGVKDTTHAVLASDAETLTRVMKQIFDFFDF